MAAIENPKVRYKFEAELIHRALDCDMQAVGTVLKYLASANPYLCHTLQTVIHELNEQLLWDKLLTVLSLRFWNGDLAHDWHLDERAINRCEQAITEVFQVDEYSPEEETKRDMLHAALAYSESAVRRSAAYLLGLRGDPVAITILSEVIESGPKHWRLRAVKALGNIKDSRAASPLVQALAQNRDLLHREARRSLKNLGPLAASAWLEALDHPDSHIRWHAARGLGEIGDPRASKILAEGLVDDNFAVRWATADVLANLGEKAVPATLTVLCHHSLTEPLRQAAYHALNSIQSSKLRTRLRPLLEALQGPAPAIVAPGVAQRLLLSWEKDR